MFSICIFGQPKYEYREQGDPDISYAKSVKVDIINSCTVVIYANWVNTENIDVQLICKNSDKTLSWIILYKDALQPPQAVRVIHLEKELEPFQTLTVGLDVLKLGKIYTNIDIYLP